MSRHPRAVGGGVSAQVATVIEATYRTEWSRIVAGLVRRCGDLGIAEDAAAEAFAAASQQWQDGAVPRSPGAWITTAAHRRAIDALRREGVRSGKHHEAHMLRPADGTAAEGGVEGGVEGEIEDDRLRLLFTCCHPVLPRESRVALTLRIVGGLTVTEIARAFLVRDTTMGQRISRAKSTIRAAGIPYREPSEEDLPARLDGVLTVLYLIFNEGYLSATEGPAPLRGDLTAEAIRLARLVHELLPDDAEATGLLALMLLAESRAAARLTADGELVTLEEQDRTLWDRGAIAEARDLGERALARLEAERTAPGRYLLMAAINAEHASAPHALDTDWARIVELYERLALIDPGPVVALGRIVALSERDGPEPALAHLDGLEEQLARYHPFHVTRAELLRASQRPAEAHRAYDQAISLTRNTAEIAHLTRRRDRLAGSPDTGPAGSITLGGTP